MLKNKFLFFTMLLLLILSVSAVSANENITGDIAISQDNSGFIQANELGEGNFNDLQKLVSDAKDNDTIILDKDYAYSAGDNKSGIVINKSLTINGNGHELDGVGNSRMLLVGDTASRITVSLKNIKFIDGYAENGGVIKIAHSTKKISLQIDNCTFENNHATLGGVIFSYDDEPVDGYVRAVTANSYITITNSKFINNVAQQDAGAIYSQGNSTTIKNSIFTGNRALDGSGGAMVIFDEGCSITNSTFDSNRAKTGAGAIDYSSSEPMFVSNCNFANNSAERGGAISLCCYYKVCQIINSTFKSNTAKLSGGAISFDSHANLKGSIFENNNLPELEVRHKQDFSLAYNSGKNFKVKIVNTLNQKPVSGVQIKLYLKLSNGGKKYKTKTLTAVTNAKGVATFKVSRLSKYYYYGHFNFAKSFKFVDSTAGNKYGYFMDFVALNDNGYEVFTIKKAATKIKAPKVTAKYKKSKYFKIKITSGKKPLKQIKLKLKVYTGKEYKIYKVKTNSNGVAKFNTKKLSWGNHEVLISSANNLLNYKISGKSKINIK